MWARRFTSNKLCFASFSIKKNGPAASHSLRFAAQIPMNVPVAIRPTRVVLCIMSFNERVARPSGCLDDFSYQIYLKCFVWMFFKCLCLFHVWVISLSKGFVNFKFQTSSFWQKGGHEWIQGFAATMFVAWRCLNGFLDGLFVWFSRWTGAPSIWTASKEHQMFGWWAITPLFLHTSRCRRHYSWWFSSTRRKGSNRAFVSCKDFGRLIYILEDANGMKWVKT